ncbi:MAG: nucleoside-diphosphate kinase [Halobacteria archaeon]
MPEQREFVMVKPDGVARGLAGEVVSRLERKGLRLVAAKLLRVSEKTAREHYAEHREKPFFKELVAHIRSGPALAMVVEGREAVVVVRALVGATDPAKAAPGTLRGDFCLEVTRNLVHASDSPASAEREIGLYFKPEELA